MTEPEQSKYLLMSITEALKRLVNTKKKDNKSLLYHPKHIKQTKDILEAHASKYVLFHYVENFEEFKNSTGEEDKKKIKSEVYYKWVVYLLFANSD